MRFLTWNASGLLKNGVNQAKADWLLSYLNNHSDIAALAIQETHCQNIDRFCQAIHDISYTALTMEPVEPGLQAPRLGGPRASFTEKKDKRRKEEKK